MRANIMSRTIEMSTAEAKRAGRFGTEAFEELSALRREYPNFRLEVKSAKRNAKVKGITYKTMEKYLDEHGTDEQKKKFAEYKNGDELGRKEYFGIVRKWFFEQYPKLNDGTAVDELTAVAAAQ